MHRAGKMTVPETNHSTGCGVLSATAAYNQHPQHRTCTSSPMPLLLTLLMVSFHFPVPIMPCGGDGHCSGGTRGIGTWDNIDDD